MSQNPPQTDEVEGKRIESPENWLFADLGLDLKAENEKLETATAEARMDWAIEHLRGRIILTSSFGAQAAVSLHMATQAWKDIPVVVIDTGYLFPETYRFIDELTDRLSLNLHVYRSDMSAAWQEARYGKLWEQGLEGIEKYNQMNKVEPLNRAVEELSAHAWIAGLRRQQSSGRSQLPVLAVSRRRLKIHPIIDWTDRDVYDYLTRYDLPYHPLWAQGYISIGDVHTTTKFEAGMDPEQVRFFGLKRECGLHEDVKTDFVI